MHRRHEKRVTCRLTLALFAAVLAQAQLTTGTVEGTVRSGAGLPEDGAEVVITGALGFRAIARTNSRGDFAVTLPHGRYRIGQSEIFVPALATVHVDLMTGLNGRVWIDTSRARVYPEPFSFAATLLSREPLSVTAPLNYTGTADHQLALESQRSYSWTYSQFKIEGMDATDSYQPGRPLILPDVQALEEIAVRSGFGQTASSSYGTEAGVFLRTPDARWHGSISTINTGTVFASSNIPPPADRGMVNQSDYFQRYSRDGLQVGGPVARWADLFASGTAEWANQTAPLQPAGANQRSRLLFGNVRARIRATSKDQFDGLFSGSRINLDNFGIPAGIEALVARRNSPSFVLPQGFAGQSETDHMDFLQAGWTRRLSEASRLGVIQVRYQFSAAHLDTNRTAGPDQSKIELLDGAVTGAAPMENLAKRTRQQIEGAWQPVVSRHRLIVGGGWRTQSPVNRITAPLDMNLITANGVPAYVVELNTPLDSASRVRAGSVYLADHWSLARWFTIDSGAFADFSRGSIPAQSSGVGIFSPARNFRAQPDLISWNSISPRVGFSWQIPHASRLVARGMYFRLYAPLSGHDLDFGNPNSLGGQQYQWIDRNGDGIFEPGEAGPLLMRFGGPYSSISPSLGRPYSDEFNVGAELRISRTMVGSFQLFRRDEKNRIAAVNVGIPSSAFTPLTLVDPGDGTPDKSNEQLGRLTVYSQNPATFGQDRYLLTNPEGLRMLNAGYMANIRAEWRGAALEASFVAEKAFGPTNPGDAVIENDAGVVGALYMDPNTLVNASGRTYFDRGYAGKFRAAFRLPLKVDMMTVVDYLDGLVFARQLLVTGLAQGPVVVAATLRGSPEGGNRAQYVLNWNLRAQREFRLNFGQMTGAVDCLNVLNGGRKIQESDISGPSFLERLPVAIQQPRVFRFLVRYDF